MKMRKKTRGIAVLLAVVMLFVMLPQFEMKTEAADNSPVIALVSNGSVSEVLGAQKNNIYFGCYNQSAKSDGGYNQDPVKWRVLSNSSGELLLLADQNLDSRCYKRSSPPVGVTWETSDVRSFLSNEFLSNAFQEEEAAAIPIVKIHTNANPKHGTTGGNDTEDKVFLLTYEDVVNTDYGFPSSTDAHASRVSSNTAYANDRGKYLSSYPDVRWMTRTKGSSSDLTDNVYINDKGEVRVNGFTTSGPRPWPIRPAIRIDLSQVLFVSAAVGGKDSQNGALTQVNTASVTDWKLTVLESSHKNFKVDPCRTAYNSETGKLTVVYSGAKTGDSEYVSAIVVGSDSKVKYYGRIKSVNNDSDKSGTCVIDLNGKVGATDKVYVFNEQYRGDLKTDYASELYEVDKYSTGDHDWEFTGFTWTGNETDGYTEVVAKYHCKTGNHDKEIKATLTSETDSPTCFVEGKTTYTATVTAEDTKDYDNTKHEESRVAKKVAVLDHNWTFTGFTWFGNEKDGYTEVIANYHCDVADHSQTLKAELSSTVIDPTCTEKGKTVFTAVVNEEAAKALDGEAREEVRNAIVTKALGHDYGAWKKLNDAEHERICSHDSSHRETEAHKWDSGKITLEATSLATGVRTYTCKVCQATRTETVPKRNTVPVARMTSKGENGLVLAWNKTEGAEGYDVFFARCRHDGVQTTYRKAATVRGNATRTWTVTGLKKGTSYKAYVKAWVKKNGKKIYIRTSPALHAYTGAGTEFYTNAKSVTVNKNEVSLNVGKRFSIKATVNLRKANRKLMPESHTSKLRYYSMDPQLASVSKKGVITAKKQGTTYIYVIAHNGVSKKIKVTIR